MSVYLVAMVTILSWNNNEMATVVDSFSSELTPSESCSSELECDLMITSLERELNLVRSQLEAVVLELSAEAERSLTPEDRKEVTTLVERLPEVTPLSERKMKRTPLPKQQSLPWNKQQYYINLVTTQEKEWLKTRQYYLQLMDQHITEQLVKLQQTGDKLTKKLHRRIAREKATRLSQRPPRFRSDPTNIPFTPAVYKSSFYKTASNEYSLKHCTSSVHSLHRRHKPRRLRGGPCHKIGNEFNEVDEEEASNSWALTAAAPINYHTNTKQTNNNTTKKTVITSTDRPPQFKPINEILGDDPHKEEYKKRTHTAKMCQLMSTQRQLHYMYELACKNQRRNNSAKSPPTLEVTLSSLIHQPSKLTIKKTTPTSPLTKPVTLPTCHQPQSPPQSPSPNTPHTMKSPSPAPPSPHTVPPLTLEAILADTSVIKEPKRLSSLWHNYIQM